VPYDLVIIYYNILHPEDGSSKVIRKVGILPQLYTSSQPRRPRQVIGYGFCTATFNTVISQPFLNDIFKRPPLRDFIYDGEVSETVTEPSGIKSVFVDSTWHTLSLMHSSGGTFKPSFCNESCWTNFWLFCL